MPTRFTRRSLVGLAAASAIASAVADAATARLWSLADEDGHEMPYVWRPASDPMNARTLVILHGHGSNETPSAASDPNWNIIVPLDRFGYNGDGSWWLGEGGDFFTMRLLHSIIGRLGRRVGRRLTTGAGLYFSGSSMGGYGSILHGILLGARAVNARAAQTRMEGTAFDEYLGRAMHPVGASGTPYANLGDMVRASDPRALPVFFLDFNCFDHPAQNYLAEHHQTFTTACADAGALFNAQVFPISGHAVPRSFSQTLGLFDAYRDAIESW